MKNMHIRHLQLHEEKEIDQIKNEISRVALSSLCVLNDGNWVHMRKSNTTSYQFEIFMIRKLLKPKENYRKSDSLH